MAAVTRSPNASIDATSAIQSGNKVPRLPGNPLMAQGAIPVSAPCRIDPATGDLVACDGAAVNTSKVVGFAGKDYVDGEPVTLFRDNTLFYYSDDFSADGVSPGDVLFIGAVGGLDTAATTGDDIGVAVVMDNHHIMVTRATTTV